MICMDLFARILRDLNDNPGTSLRWLLEYVVNLNAPESKAADFRAALLRLLKYKALSLKSVRRAWDANRLSPSIGIAVDAQCKDVFNGKKSADEVGPVSRVILTQLQALHLSPICAGLKVAGVPTPDRSGDGGGGRYTYHNGCVRGCRSLRGRDAFYTEVDLVAHDMVTNTVALLELKTRSNDVLDDATLWRYNTQLWLTWTMFSLTYPSAGGAIQRTCQRERLRGKRARDVRAEHGQDTGAQLHAGGTSRSLRGARERRPGRAEAERERDQVSPRVEFCKRHLGEIEYAAMKLLADVGMKEKLFLVTGAEWGHGESSPGSSAGLDGDLVSFHFRYLDCRELEEDRSLLVAPDPLAAVAGPEEFSDLDPSYCDGEIRRPRGLSGLFVSTFAEPTSERLATLREVCRGCGGSEADTLLVELANALEGAVTVCTGDSDLVAVLTASGREGLTLRLDNRSYREDRAMHDSPFGELLSEPNPERARGSGLPPGDASSRDGRFRALCDVQLGDEGLLPRAQELHEDFERILEDHGGASFRSEAVDYLYRGGVRGSVYVAFLGRFFESDARNDLNSFALELQKPRERSSANAVRHVF
ncbi:hypothetical protein Q5P01_000790 [Channa striata]|uniref:Uncharacterized protein n=1 Tax=Channa striata TaxID=64152 RepID=A0AA88IYQ4_CHASR|nr:hypothetical protein Q5P01_000790 [Channa striata]